MLMLDYFGKLNRNIIDQIQYRGTMVTGVITADNGDGTYAVKIAQADRAHPYVETAFPNMVFGVGEVVLVTFEYGNKEMPRILGYAKKIAQHPVDVEVDYSGEIPIDIGSPVVTREGQQGPTAVYTMINKTNPASANGKITSVEIYAAVEDAINVEVATFFVVSGNNLSTRDHEAIGTVIAGSKQTFPVNLDVEEGDYIGLYLSSGKIYIDFSGGVGYWYQNSKQIPCVNSTFYYQEDWEFSLYGTGLT